MPERATAALSVRRRAISVPLGGHPGRAVVPVVLAALIRAIGFANKAEKIEKFKAASADLVITSMKELFAYL